MKKIVANNRKEQRIQNKIRVIDKSIAEFLRSRNTKSGAYVRDTKTDERERRLWGGIGGEKTVYFFMAIYLL